MIEKLTNKLRDTWGGGAVPLLGLLLAGLFVNSGCDDTPLSCPGVPAGHITGTVRCGGTPIEATIIATLVPENDQFATVFESSPNSAGEYALDVPEGRYTISLRIQPARWIYDYRADQPGYGTLPPDTLTIRHNTVATDIDFNLASMKVHVDLSTHLDGESGEVRLHRHGTVYSHRTNTYVNRGGNTINEGAFDALIAGVLPGEYKVEVVLGPRYYMCYCPYDGEHLWLPGTQDSSAVPWMDIRANQMIEETLAVATDPARIEGEIIGAWQELGKSLPPTLALLSPDSTTIMGPRVINDDGSFGVCVHVPGPVKLLVMEEGVEQWIGGRSFADAETYSLALGDTLSGIRLEQCGMRITLDAPPVEESSYGNELTYSLYDADNGLSVCVWTTDLRIGSGNGFPNLRPGSYRMRIDPRRRGFATFVSQWFDRQSTYELAQTITIAHAGEIAPVTVELIRGAAISGSVVQTSGPAVNYFVLISPAEEKIRWGYNYAWDNSLDYRLLGLPDGDWKIGAFAWPADHSGLPDGIPPGVVWHPATSDWDAATVVQVRDHTDVGGIDIQIN